MPTVGELAYIVSADTSKFTKGMVASKAELREAKKVFEATRTPAEKYGAEVQKLDNLHKKGAIDAETHRRAVKRAADSYREATGSAKSFGAAMSSFLGNLGANAASLGIGKLISEIKQGLSEVMNFQQAMANSTAIAGEVSAAGFAKMESQAHRIAYQTKFSATEAAQGYEFLISSGLNAEQAVAASGVTAKFAQAGTMDLANATKYLTDAQGALGLKSADVTENMRQMQRVGDVLTKGNMISTASVEDMSKALTTKAATAARLVGMELEEVAGWIAVLADQGIKGEEAGTNFAITLRELQSASLENADAFKKAKIAVFDQRGELRKLADIVGDMEKRLGSMSDAEKKAELAALGFTDKSMGTIQAMLGMSEKGRDFVEQMQKAAGTLDDVASKKFPALAQALHQTKAVWDAFLTQSLTPTADAMGKMATQDMPMMGKGLAFLLDATDALSQSWQGWQTLAANVGALPLEAINALAGAVINFENELRRMAGLEAIKPKWLADSREMALAAGKAADDSVKAWEKLNKQETRGEKFRRQFEEMTRPLDNGGEAAKTKAAADPNAQAALDSMLGSYDPPKNRDEWLKALDMTPTLSPLDAYRKRLDDIQKAYKEAGISAKEMAEANEQALHKLLGVKGADDPFTAFKARLDEIAMLDLEGKFKTPKQHDAAMKQAQDQLRKDAGIMEPKKDPFAAAKEKFAALQKYAEANPADQAGIRATAKSIQDEFAKSIEKTDPSKATVGGSLARGSAEAFRLQAERNGAGKGQNIQEKQLKALETIARRLLEAPPLTITTI